MFSVYVYVYELSNLINSNLSGMFSRKFGPVLEVCDLKREEHLKLHVAKPFCRFSTPWEVRRNIFQKETFARYDDNSETTVTCTNGK